MVDFKDYTYKPSSLEEFSSGLKKKEEPKPVEVEPVVEPERVEIRFEKEPVKKIDKKKKDPTPKIENPTKEYKERVVGPTEPIEHDTTSSGTYSGGYSGYAGSSYSSYPSSRKSICSSSSRETPGVLASAAVVCGRPDIGFLCELFDIDVDIGI